METFVFRGAAVEIVIPLRCREDRRRRPPPSSSSPPPRTNRRRPICFVSRPGVSSGPPGPLDGVRRGRTPDSINGGTGAGPVPPRPPVRTGPAGPPGRGRPSAACRCSCFRMWSARGLAPPALALRIASRGSFTSGFWAAGSCETRGAAGRLDEGRGASLNAGRGSGLGPSPPGRRPVGRGRGSVVLLPISGGLARAATPPGAM